MDKYCNLWIYIHFILSFKIMYLYAWIWSVRSKHVACIDMINTTSCGLTATPMPILIWYTTTGWILWNELEVLLHSLLTSTLDEGESSTRRPGLCTTATNVYDLTDENLLYRTSILLMMASKHSLNVVIDQSIAYFRNKREACCAVEG
jgi:hypothetical protein